METTPVQTLNLATSGQNRDARTNPETRGPIRNPNPATRNHEPHPPITAAVKLIQKRKADALRELRLKQALINYVCNYCGAGNPEIYKTDGRIRYVRCRQCSSTDPGKIVISEDDPNP